VLFTGRFKATATYCGPNRFMLSLYITFPMVAMVVCYAD